MTPNQWIEKLEWRYATKQFDKTKKIPADVWESIEDSLVLTPSSFGLQPWKFIVVKDETVRQELLPHSWNQPQVVDASHLIVLAARTPIQQVDIDQFITSTHETRGGDIADLDMYKGMMSGFISRMDEDQRTTWAKNQAYIALGQLMSTAAAIGIDACPMEGIVPTEYDTVLGLNGTGYTTTLACPMGYRDTDDKYAQAPKVRYPKSSIITHI